MGAVPALIGLHGFTQVGRMFDELSHYLPRHLTAPDLPGHGDASGVAPTSEAITSLVQWLAEGEPPVLVGYSMGGRLAIQYALEHPVDRLVLISTGPGIADPTARAERQHADAALAQRIEQNGVESFIDSWIDQPLFAGLKRRDPIWQAVDRQTRLLSSASGLANALVNFGQGSTPYVGDRLSDIDVPVLIVAGSEDTKYVDIATEMHQRLPRSQIALLDEVGHSVVGEAPAKLGDLITRFLY